MGEWKWYAGRDNENYTVGPEDTRKAVIAAGRQDFDGEAFHIIEARKGTMRPWLPSASDIVEQMFDRAYEDGAFGDDYGEPYGPLEAQKAADDDLDALLAAWYERHADVFPTPWMFAESRNAETIPAAGRAALGHSDD